MPRSMSPGERLPPDERRRGEADGGTRLVSSTQAAEIVQGAADSSANIIFGAVIDDALTAMEADIEATTHKLLDQLAGERRTDLIESFAAQLPVTVIADLLGVPAEERAPLLGWGDGAARLLDTGLGLRPSLDMLLSGASVLAGNEAVALLLFTPADIGQLHFTRNAPAAERKLLKKRRQHRAAGYRPGLKHRAAVDIAIRQSVIRH